MKKIIDIEQLSQMEREAYLKRAKERCVGYMCGRHIPGTENYYWEHGNWCKHCEHEINLIQKAQKEERARLKLLNKH